MPVSDFQPVIGLEVHAQLLTQSKIFCGCSTAFGAEPNRNTCPVCLGMPGVLPVLNQRVAEFAVRTGLALECTIRPTSVWSRKNYFYPDLPKGYQITQFDQPICEHGRLVIDTPQGEKAIRILRIHMEEDAGKSVHDAGGGQSLVDLNRAGVPLLEIVSQPDLRDADEAVEYLKAMRDVLVYLGVNDGNLEEGSFRCDANVSVMPKGSTTFGQRCELKNLNSFRFLKQAIEYEIARQVDVIESGGKVVQETRLWDVNKGVTRSMRSKEEAHDYRYFPEPDLPPLHVSAEAIAAAAKALPELPRAKLQRFTSQYGLPAYDARILTAERPLADYFEACAGHYKDYKKLSNWFLGELMRLLKEEGTPLSALRFTPAQLGELLGAVDQGMVSANAGKDVLGEMFRTGKAPADIIAEKGLAQVSDTGAIEAVVDDILAKNAGEIEKYRAGKKQVFGFFVGQVMRAMKGKGNPALVNELLKKKLGD
ncbi:glutamyl-tRNA(Gln) amidotransferase, B subunit [Myxococcus xanthus DK 1622]|uniref:Aspartyl/glutamyl-tRNA(Asn/Gln) amidotransferase subunit B n=1 Tax=Myxococcus xanthus (strain DK1622) TaxID=246197 RepID=GATB_MYXXD|nr:MULTISPECIES: Asp-tRNA(Asn)/Glu-tRNA(Gln) amidotransferase subunit GatB [Myxococcus]Q1DCA2.1 RecName: Full=Aspartyl/glutamyl-tRNA(Asn/Gln) amidotransferase subunit B; Short=Asp/Glu-ADT subunit B [Myxococcus xanthus DK 1622]ABF88634.1 glutamyl-tRNA(Gln) amidotransferase, B subunit [Myxococcus xanthus DK 1622]NOJ57675.1 Asp-tRNA(Asn)/Glu-tRNA(Gln) amidotransferase subunit GatB [Myxococcus xanthus]QPM81102.1 Asp-tRNA(Asn)/Glu-tRNA(Gln) amidotransferase subunit GatB [Myxococcus xanthus]QVW70161